MSRKSGVLGFAAETEVPAQRSRQEVEELLQRNHCTQYLTAVDYGKHQATVQFKLQERIVRFVIEIPSNTERHWEQKERQRWRQLLLVVKAKLEAVAFGIASFEEEFLPYIVLPGDVTAGEIFIPLIAAAYTSGKLPAGLALPAKGDTQR